MIKKCGELDCVVTERNVSFEQVSKNVFICDYPAAALGEGLFFCNSTRSICWFDILGNSIFILRSTHLTQIELPFAASCGAECSDGRAIIASTAGLFKCDINSLTFSSVPANGFPALSAMRTNDGRSDHFGSFWFSTMSVRASEPTGQIFRFHNSHLSLIHSGLYIPNSICFHPDRKKMVFSDTGTRKLYSYDLNDDGFPVGNCRVERDFILDEVNPDGAICNASGSYFIAMWGAGNVTEFDANFAEIRAFSFPCLFLTCPGIADWQPNRLWVTSASNDEPNPYAGRLMYHLLEAE